eukprot:CAMPEP_0172782588 /NCGR_PEP_ID=MMETSP1074-20121228/204004_1 /TAXON_ID=2916 /ORGANISM="Ceratium fusus, Strain PA161109" /LENGTH=288 /DNA_ID=CAMNT_0013619571 /DNA_START=118 /DNA_END=985 /DNA_ORIENTATION=+
MHRHVTVTVHGAHRNGDHRIRSTTNVAAPLLSTPQVGTASNSNICSMTWRSPPPVACLKQRQLTALHHVDIVFEGWTANATSQMPTAAAAPAAQGHQLKKHQAAHVTSRSPVGDISVVTLSHALAQHQQQQQQQQHDYLLARRWSARVQCFLAMAVTFRHFVLKDPFDCNSSSSSGMHTHQRCNLPAVQGGLDLSKLSFSFLLQACMTLKYQCSIAQIPISNPEQSAAPNALRYRKSFTMSSILISLMLLARRWSARVQCFLAMAVTFRHFVLKDPFAPHSHQDQPNE